MKKKKTIKRKKKIKINMFMSILGVMNKLLYLTGVYVVIMRSLGELPMVKRYALNLAIKGFFAQWSG